MKRVRYVLTSRLEIHLYSFFCLAELVAVAVHTKEESTRDTRAPDRILGRVLGLLIIRIVIITPEVGAEVRTINRECRIIVAVFEAIGVVIIMDAVEVIYHVIEAVEDPIGASEIVMIAIIIEGNDAEFFLCS